jgi:hypothetical protein
LDLWIERQRERHRSREGDRETATEIENRQRVGREQDIFNHLASTTDCSSPSDPYEAFGGFFLFLLIYQKTVPVLFGSLLCCDHRPAPGRAETSPPSLGPVLLANGGSYITSERCFERKAAQTELRGKALIITLSIDWPCHRLAPVICLMMRAMRARAHRAPTLSQTA